MKVNELKVGDRVKYKIEHGICGINHSTTEIAEGSILEIRTDYGGFFQIGNNKYSGNQISVRKEDIISKLEPLQPQYKEIKIEQENKSSIKISDLMVGNRVKILVPVSNVFYGIIKGLPINYDNINFSIHCDGESYQRPISPNYIVAKLEPIYCNYCIAGESSFEYKEIPIEKEKE